MNKDNIDLFRAAKWLKERYDYDIEYKKDEIVASIRVLKNSYVSVDSRGNVSVNNNETSQVNRSSIGSLEGLVKIATDIEKKKTYEKELDKDIAGVGGIPFQMIAHTLVSSFDENKKVDENTPGQVTREITFYDKEGNDVVTFSAGIGIAEDVKWVKEYGVSEAEFRATREHTASGIDIWKPYYELINECEPEELDDMEPGFLEDCKYNYPMFKAAVEEADRILANLEKEPTPYTNGYMISMKLGEKYGNEEINAKVYNNEVNSCMRSIYSIPSWTGKIRNALENNKEVLSHAVSFKEHSYDERHLPSHDFDIKDFSKTVDPYQVISDSLGKMNLDAKRMIIAASEDDLNKKFINSLCQLEEISYATKQYIDHADSKTRRELFNENYLNNVRRTTEHALGQIKDDLEKNLDASHAQKYQNTINNIERNLDGVFRLDKAIETEVGKQMQDMKVDLTAKNMNTVMDFMKAPKYNKELLSVIDKANFTGDERLADAKAEAEKILDTNRDIAKHLCREISAIKDSRDVSLEQAVERLSDVYTSLDNTKNDFNVEEMFEAMIKNMPEVYDRLSANEREANTHSFSKDTMSFEER